MSFDSSIYKGALSHDCDPGSISGTTIHPFTYLGNNFRRADQSQIRNTASSSLPHYSPPTPPPTRGTSEVESARGHADDRHVQGDGDIQPAVGALPPMLAPFRGDYDGCYWNSQGLFAALVQSQSAKFKHVGKLLDSTRLPRSR